MLDFDKPKILIRLDQHSWDLFRIRPDHAIYSLFLSNSGDLSTNNLHFSTFLVKILEYNESNSFTISIRSTICASGNWTWISYEPTKQKLSCSCKSRWLMEWRWCKHSSRRKVSYLQLFHQILFKREKVLSHIAPLLYITAARTA